MFPSDIQILKLVQILKELGKIKFEIEFCEAIGMSKQHFQNIKRQLQSQEEKKQNFHFTAQQIGVICKTYGVDANWIHCITDQVFLVKNSKKIVK